MAGQNIRYAWDDYDDWYYKTSRQYQGWKYIVLHHSATEAGSVESFDKFHRQQGYGGIAYHFVIGNGHGMRDGEIKETFRWKKQISGTHVSVNSWEHNVFGIGICLVGNLQNHPPSRAQLESLTRLIQRLSRRFRIPAEQVVGHRHVRYDDQSGKTEKTACPGRQLDWAKIKRD